MHLCLPNYDTYGATNLLTTVEDLALWEENFYTAHVGGIQAIQQLQQPGTLNDGTRLNYAPGEFVGTLGGLKWAESGTAGDAGYRSDVIRFPDKHCSIISLCNLGSIDPMDLNSHIADIYIANKLSEARSAEAGPASAFHADPKLLDAYTGIYTDRDENYVLKLEKRADGLWAESFTGPNEIGPAELEAVDENRFRGVGMKELAFTADHRDATAQRSGMPSLHFARVPEYKPTVPELREFAGEYSSKELDVPYHLTVDGNALVLHAPKSTALVIAPVTKDLFIGGDRRIRFTRDSKGSVSGLLMSGYWNRVQNLRFIRAPKL
jgi:hypothetical protein